MAIFHATLKTFSRAKGHTAPAAAAYRTARRLHDDRTGLTHDYRRRRGVVEVLVLAPASSPRWAHDVEQLWSAVELSEARINARVARELEVALPVELDSPGRSLLARAIAQTLVDRYQVAVTAAIHEPSETGDSRNHHVHLMMTTRQISSTGFGPKVRVLDDRKTGPEEVLALREMVAVLTNKHLSRSGINAQVDHRSLDAQAAEAADAGDLVQVAMLSRTAAVHEGKAATAAKRCGRRARRADENQSRRRSNEGLKRRAVEFVQSTAGKRRKGRDAGAGSGRKNMASDSGVAIRVEPSMIGTELCPTPSRLDSKGSQKPNGAGAGVTRELLSGTAPTVRSGGGSSKGSRVIRILRHVFARLGDILRALSKHWSTSHYHRNLGTPDQVGEMKSNVGEAPRTDSRSVPSRPATSAVQAMLSSPGPALLVSAPSPTTETQAVAVSRRLRYVNRARVSAYDLGDTQPCKRFRIGRGRPMADLDYRSSRPPAASQRRHFRRPSGP